VENTAVAESNSRRRLLGLRPAGSYAPLCYATPAPTALPPGIPSSPYGLTKNGGASAVQVFKSIRGWTV